MHGARVLSVSKHLRGEMLYPPPPLPKLPGSTIHVALARDDKDHTYTHTRTMPHYIQRMFICLIKRVTNLTNYIYVQEEIKFHNLHYRPQWITITVL